jgi:hypothetical protein
MQAAESGLKKGFHKYLSTIFINLVKIHLEILEVKSEHHSNSKIKINAIEP